MPALSTIRIVGRQRRVRIVTGRELLALLPPEDRLEQRWGGCVSGPGSPVSESRWSWREGKKARLALTSRGRCGMAILAMAQGWDPGTPGQATRGTSWPGHLGHGEVPWTAAYKDVCGDQMEYDSLPVPWPHRAHSLSDGSGLKGLKIVP